MSNDINIENQQSKHMITSKPLQINDFVL